MTMTIALAGKGGTGKTTLAGLIVAELIRRGRTPVLAVDADPNATLNEALGVDVESTVGQVRDEILALAGSAQTSSIPKETLLEYRIQESLVESDGFDLLVMGLPEGPGCYCYANSILRKYMDIVSKNYSYIVMDNEAGMEHLSRVTTRDVDYLLIVSDATVRGIKTVMKIQQLVKELKIKTGHVFLVIGRSEHQIEPELQEYIDRTGIELLTRIPYDRYILDFDLQQKPFAELPEDSASRQAAATMIDRLEELSKQKTEATPVS